ncbi:hypothetical protein HO173_011352 [Letharia columbiana]|uniref:Uncharacterized protein n=1 Tax=Letharia columbiana TaxID=112416 RepID=A0A8H6FJH6_9LECA|nr:uncharacterized protein HO173_011352 [Letharia columbiana]KAF6229706.1 hypothetical protein HO173_011352 [Letharia columbiana]
MSAPRSPYRRGPWNSTTRLTPAIDNVLSERQEGRHDELRKKMVADYAGKENLRLESEIDERKHDLISLIERKYVCTDRSRKAQFFTLDVISGWAFDQAFGDLIVDEDLFEYIKTVDKAMHVLLSMSELPEVYSFLETSSLMKLMAPSATDKIGVGKLIAIAKEKVAKRFRDNRKVK